MRRPGGPLLLLWPLAALLLSQQHCSEAAREVIDKTWDDGWRHLIEYRDLVPQENSPTLFALDRGGIITVELDVVEPNGSGVSAVPANNTFVLVLTQGQWGSILVGELPSLTAVDKKVVNSNLYSYYRAPLGRGVRFQTLASQKDRYLVVLVNGDKQPIHLRGVVQMMNPGGEHLSYDQIPMGPALIAMLWLYLTAGVVFTFLLVTVWRNYRTHLHTLMLGVLLSRSLYLVLAWNNLLYYSAYGTLSTLQSGLADMVFKLHEIIALLMLLLVALGWKVLRPSLTMTEVRFAAGICVISFYLGLFEVSCEGPTCGGYKLSRYILHSLAFLCIIVAVNFNVTMLQSHIQEATVGLQTGEMYLKQEGYKTYRWLFIFYIMKPTTLLFFKLVVLSLSGWDDYVYVLAQHLVDFAIYVIVMWSFRPEHSLRVFKELIPPEGGDDATPAPPAPAANANAQPAGAAGTPAGAPATAGGGGTPASNMREMPS